MAVGGRQFGKDKRRGRNRELDQPVGAFERGRDVARHLDAIRTQSCEFARVATNHRRAFGFDRAGKGKPFADGHGMDQRAPHASAGAGNYHPHVGHRLFLPVNAI